MWLAPSGLGTVTMVSHTQLIEIIRKALLHCNRIIRAVSSETNITIDSIHIVYDMPSSRGSPAVHTLCMDTTGSLRLNFRSREWDAGIVIQLVEHSHMQSELDLHS